MYASRQHLDGSYAGRVCAEVGRCTRCFLPLGAVREIQEGELCDNGAPIVGITVLCNNCGHIMNAGQGMFYDKLPVELEAMRSERYADKLKEAQERVVERFWG